MRLKEIVFQGLFDCRAPVRVQAPENVVELALPPGMGTSDLQDLLISIIYPSKTPSALRMQYAQNPSVKVAAIFDVTGKTLRVVRKSEVETLRLQALGPDKKYKEIASGRDDVETYLAARLGLPSFEQFWTLNCWRYDQAPMNQDSLDVDMLDSRVRTVVVKYREALAAEAVEDELKSVEGRIAETSKRLGRGIEMEEKLRKAREKLAEIEVSELSEEELELLSTKDQKVEDFTEQIDRLTEQEDAAQTQLEKALPSSAFRNPLLWIGLVIGFGAIAVAAIDPSMRSIVLLDILGFGLAAVVLFIYFAGMERASVHQVRLESIKRRLNQVREDHAGLEERIGHLLIHAGVRDARELGERVTKSAKLRKMISQLSKEVGDLRRDASYVSASEELRGLEERFSELKLEREKIPPDVMSAYQLETDLQSMGIDPLAVAEAPDPDKEEKSTAEEDTATPIERILESAHDTSQWDGRELHAKTKKMWSKICTHVLGDRFGEVSLDKTGELQLGALAKEQMKMWKRTRPQEYQMVISALALAIQINAGERSQRGFFQTMVINDPSKVLTGTQPKKLREVFKSAAKKVTVVMCRQGV